METQSLTRRILERLLALTTSDTPSSAEHLGALRAVALIARDTSEVSLILADAVTVFPLTAATLPQPTPGARDPGRTGHDRARQAVTGKLHDASRILQSCATACLYAAAPLADHTVDPAPATDHHARGTSSARAAPVKAPDRPRSLTRTQQTALRAIAAGIAVMYDSGRNGRPRITATGGVRITMRTYDALRSLRLVDRDPSTSLYSGQKLYATTAGRASLAALPSASGGQPAPTPPTKRRR